MCLEEQPRKEDRSEKWHQIMHTQNKTKLAARLRSNQNRTVSRRLRVIQIYNLIFLIIPVPSLQKCAQPRAAVPGLLAVEADVILLWTFSRKMACN